MREVGLLFEDKEPETDKAQYLYSLQDSLHLSQIFEYMSPKFHALNIVAVDKETDDAVVLTFEVPQELKEEYHYKSGQYLTLKKEFNGEELRRSYSICSAPHENTLKVAIKQIDGGVFSTWANTDLTIGTSIEVMTPTGHFVQPEETAYPGSFLLVAAGSGITPILSLAKTLLNAHPNNDVSLVYGNKGFHSIMFREEIEALKNTHISQFRVVHVLSRESLGNPIQKGRINQEKLEKITTAFFANQAIDHVYVCGPESIVQDARKVYEHSEKTKLHFELFGTALPTKSAAEKAVVGEDIDSRVLVIIDGDELELEMTNHGSSILDAAQAAGADLPYACKGGVCCTCKARILEGKASMDVNYALEKDEVEAGYILTCQAHPITERLVVSFDE